MQKSIFRKGVFVGIILLFVGVSVIPGISGNTGIKDKDTQINKLESISLTNTDWWSMFRHDLEHSGCSTSQVPKTNNVLWTYLTNEDIFSSPAVVNNRVYFGTLGVGYGMVYCLDSETGSKLWDYTTGDWVISSPAVAENMLYFGCTDGNMYCLDAFTGDLIWKKPIPWISSSPAVFDGKVYFGSFDKNVYCLDANSGDLIWNCTTDYIVQSSPAVVDGKVFIGCGQYNNGGMLYCLNAINGSLIWNKYIGGIVASSPTVALGRVYVGYSTKEQNAGGVTCLYANNGSIIWSYTTDNIIYYSSPAVFNNMVFIGSIDCKLYCLDAIYGDLIWSYTTGGYIESSPAVADGKVLIGSMDKNVYCFDLSGDLSWKYTTGDLVVSSPAVANGKVYIGSYDNKLYCFGLKNSPPGIPLISGPTYGKIGNYYPYDFVSEDPDGDDVYYEILWGDGSHEDWFGPYESNEVIIKSHKWNQIGNYTIMVRSKDVYDAKGDWGTLEVTMPRNKAVSVQLIKLLENYQFLFRFLQQMIHKS